MLGADWTSVRLNFDPSSLMDGGRGNRKYVRSYTVASSAQLNYDAGYLFVGSNGQSTSNTIGCLYLDYDVELFSPIVGGAASLPTPGNTSLFYNSATQTPINDNTKTYVLFDQVEYDALGLGTQAGNGMFYPPPGSYLVTANVSLYVTGGTTGDSVLYQLGGVVASPGVSGSFTSVAFHSEGEGVIPATGVLELFASTSYVVNIAPPLQATQGQPDGFGIQVYATYAGAGTMQVYAKTASIIVRLA
jgi:hypothetical protein